MTTRLIITTLTFLLLASFSFNIIHMETIERHLEENEFDSAHYSKIVSMLHERINSLE